MSLLLIVGVFAAIYLLVFVWGLAMGKAARRGDEQAREAFRRARQERKARSDPYGNGGWRG
jgi:hypothetical protein